VPASGYFEWKPEGAAKQPFYIHDPDGELLMFAGLRESWRETKENDALHFHDRHRAASSIESSPPYIAC
jgi:putative SOS response-associated peptidase YedK